VAGHRVTLPLLGWEEKDPVKWGTYHLVRACPGFLCLSSEIDVSHIVPPVQYPVTETDQQELEKDRRAVSLLNQRRPQSDAAIVVIKTPAMNLDCVRGTLGLPPIGVSARLECAASKFPYTITLHAPTSEKEAESILSTLQ